MTTTTVHQAQDIVSARVSTTISSIASTLLESCGRVTYEYEPAPRKSSIVGDFIASAEQVAAQVPMADEVFVAKRAVLWQLLSPDLQLVDSVLRMTPSWDGETLSDVHYSAAHFRLTELLEQQIFRNPGTEPGAGMDLARFAATADSPASSAVGWARQLLRACAGDVIRRTESKALNSAFETELGSGPLAGASTSWTVPVTPSPEEIVIAAADDELRTAGRSDDQIFDSWHAAAHSQTGQAQSKRGAEKLHADAAALREQFALPAVCGPETAAELRALLTALTAAPALARRSLEAVEDGDFTAALTGDRDVDSMLLSLWDDFSAADRDRLLELGANVAELIVAAAATLPAKPSRPQVIAFTQAVRIAMPTASRDLVNAFIAEHRSTNLGFNHVDTHTALLTAEADLAAQWQPLAAEVLGTPGAPASVTTVAGLAVWMESLLAA